MRKPPILLPFATLVMLATLLIALPAHAHVSGTHDMSFVAGLLHFLLEPTHLPAMLVLGFISTIAVLFLIGRPIVRRQKRER